MATSTLPRATRTWRIPISSGASRCSTGPGSFSESSAKQERGRASSGRRTRLEFDSKGQLVVADRHNHRIQVLTKAGKFIREYDDFGRTSGLAIDKNDVIYTADSESTERVHPGWQRGIRIGSLKDGKVTIFIPPHMTAEFSGRRDGGRHRHRCGRQRLHSGSATEGRDEIR